MLVYQFTYKNIKRYNSTPSTASLRHMPNLSVRYVRLEGKKKDFPPEQLKRATIKKIESIKADLDLTLEKSSKS